MSLVEPPPSLDDVGKDRGALLHLRNELNTELNGHVEIYQVDDDPLHRPDGSGILGGDHRDRVSPHFLVARGHHPLCPREVHLDLEPAHRPASI